MTVTYFSKSSSVGPSSRYRVFQFLPHFQVAGIDCRVAPLFGDTYFSILEVRSRALQICLKIPYVCARFLKRLATVLMLRRQDLVITEGPLFPYAPPVVERLLRRLGQRVVVEMDDAIHLTPGHETKIPALLTLASGVIVGNERLAAYARQCSSNVRVVPTVVDTDRFAPLERRGVTSNGHADDPITIVWMGLAYNLKYLTVLVPALRALQSQYPVKLRVVCSHAPQLAGVDVEFRPWDFSREVTDLQDATIGVMPLEDTEWARGKCGLKLLQYLAVGLPAVASPVGVNSDIIVNGENGFLAMTEDEWYERLLALCRQPELRTRMGQAGRKTVESGYSLALWGPRLADVYRALGNGESIQAVSRPVRRPMSGQPHSTGGR